MWWNGIAKTTNWKRAEKMHLMAKVEVRILISERSDFNGILLGLWEDHLNGGGGRLCFSLQMQKQTFHFPHYKEQTIFTRSTWIQTISVCSKTVCKWTTRIMLNKATFEHKLTMRLCVLSWRVNIILVAVHKASEKSGWIQYFGSWENIFDFNVLI